jgi:hypothetical protein
LAHRWTIECHFNLSGSLCVEVAQMLFAYGHGRLRNNPQIVAVRRWAAWYLPL